MPILWPPAGSLTQSTRPATAAFEPRTLFALLVMASPSLGLLGVQLAPALRFLMAYWETVWMTLLTGRALVAVGSFISFIISSSYSGKLCTGAFGFMNTTL